MGVIGTGGEGGGGAAGGLISMGGLIAGFSNLDSSFFLKAGDEVGDALGGRLGPGEILLLYREMNSK